MTPVEMELALQYYYLPPDRIAATLPQSPARLDAAQMLVARGLLECRLRGESYDSLANYESTEALEVYIDALRQVPLPQRVERWVIPETKIGGPA